MRQEATTPPKTERVVSRVAPASKILLEQSALREAKRIIYDNQKIVLTTEDTEAFMNALNNPPEPNKILLESVKLHSENVEIGR